jgi:hypothetical protein
MGRAGTSGATAEERSPRLSRAVFGAEDGSFGSPTPVTLPSNPEDLAMVKAELQQKLLQIEEFEGRARQDSNLRPSDS